MFTYTGIITLQTTTFRQTIVNTGLSAFSNHTNARSALDFCHLGSGVTPVAPTDTDLAIREGTFSPSSPFAGATSSSSLTVPYWNSSTRSYTFPAGSFNGQQLTEIGFFSLSQVMFSRTLIKDLQGNVQPIVVPSDEALTVTYEVRKYPPLADTVGSFTLDGNVYNYVTRAANSTSSVIWAPFNTIQINEVKVYEVDTLGTVTGFPVGTSQTTSATTVFSGSSLKVSVTLGTDVGNYATGIGAVTFGNSSTGAMYQMSFSPKLPKNSNVSLILNDLLQVSWGNR